MNINVPIQFSTTMPTRDCTVLIYDIEDKFFYSRHFIKGKFYSPFEKGDEEDKIPYLFPNRFLYLEETTASKIDVISHIKNAIQQKGYTDVMAVKCIGGFFVRSYGTKQTDDYGFVTKVYFAEDCAWMAALNMVNK